MTVGEMSPIAFLGLILIALFLFWTIRGLWLHRHELAPDIPSKVIFWVGFGSLAFLPAYLALVSFFPWLPVI